MVNYFKARQEAYTSSRMRLPDWGDGEFLVWGTVAVEKSSADENGVVTTSLEDYTGLIKVIREDYHPFVPTEDEEQSLLWERL